ncbi:predicted protein [Arabidopsis lyrata subsp. lyrata]|uniref:Predicted protein n=1 Tax=Arabidopsis lyrata subsp. lyrata TaxID=81972 RepID=D7M6V6_ARALL|nr:predicted protein [Arabidopsis lyrata subsp. lyrata]
MDSVNHTLSKILQLPLVTLPLATSPPWTSLPTISRSLLLHFNRNVPQMKNLFFLYIRLYHHVFMMPIRIRVLEQQDHATKAQTSREAELENDPIEAGVGGVNGSREAMIDATEARDIL